MVNYLQTAITIGGGGGGGGATLLYKPYSYVPPLKGIVFTLF